jgi:hypothetical protein
MNRGLGAIALLVAWSAPCSAQALQTGWYGGVSAGWTNYQPAVPTITGTAGPGGAGSYRGFVGYAFRPSFAVEGGYLAVGEAKYLHGWPSGVFGACSINIISPCNGNVREEVSTSLFSAAGVVTVPLPGRLSLSGTLGAASVAVATTSSQYVTVKARETHLRPYWGAGVRHALTSRVALRADWQIVPRAYASVEESRATLHSLQAGVVVQLSPR